MYQLYQHKMLQEHQQQDWGGGGVGGVLALKQFFKTQQQLKALVQCFQYGLNHYNPSQSLVMVYRSSIIITLVENYYICDH